MIPHAVAVGQVGGGVWWCWCDLCAAFSWQLIWASQRLWSPCSCCGSTWWLMVSRPLPWASTPLTWTSCRSPPATPGKASSPAGSSSATWQLEVRISLAFWWGSGGERLQWWGLFRLQQYQDNQVVLSCCLQHMHTPVDRRAMQIFGHKESSGNDYSIQKKKIDIWNIAWDTYCE